VNRYILSEIRKEHYDSIMDYRNQMLQSGDRLDGCSSLEQYEDMEKWHLNLKLFEKKESVPPGYSLGFEYVYLDGDEVVGMINIRPEALDHPYLKKYGGHIGYSVKPSRRKNGVASNMLKDALKLCKEKFGLQKVLITCKEDNEGSRKVIMNNGGVFEGKISYPPEDTMIERYWISL